ncbi:MAG: hypothetical protein QOJ59_2545 [Thermomicrobiales bacterium]|nr:hypothetical protein [Thermomicrobiales bacterium]
MLALQRTSIYLEEDQLEALKVLAAARGCSLATVVGEAVDRFVHDRLGDDVVWRTQFERLIVRVGSRIPPSITAGEIEADITKVRDDVRQLGRRSGRR